MQLISLPPPLPAFRATLGICACPGVNMLANSNPFSESSEQEPAGPVFLLLVIPLIRHTHVPMCAKAIAVWRGVLRGEFSTKYTQPRCAKVCGAKDTMRGPSGLAPTTRRAMLTGVGSCLLAIGGKLQPEISRTRENLMGWADGGRCEKTQHPFEPKQVNIIAAIPPMRREFAFSHE